MILVVRVYVSVCDCRCVSLSVCVYIDVSLCECVIPVVGAVVTYLCGCTHDCRCANESVRCVSIFVQFIQTLSLCVVVVSRGRAGTGTRSGAQGRGSPRLLSGGR